MNGIILQSFHPEPVIFLGFTLNLYIVMGAFVILKFLIEKIEMATINILPSFNRLIHNLTQKMVWFHEFMHFIAMRVVFLDVKMQNIKIKDLEGSILFRWNNKLTFTKIIFICFAPLIGGARLGIFILNIFPNMHFFIKFALVFLLISVIMVSSPSGPDLKMIFTVINARILVFIKQCGYLLFSSALFILFYDRFLILGVYFPYGFELLSITLVYVSIEAIERIIQIIFKLRHHRTQYISHYIPGQVTRSVAEVESYYNQYVARDSNASNDKNYNNRNKSRRMRKRQKKDNIHATDLPDNPESFILHSWNNTSSLE